MPLPFAQIQPFAPSTQVAFISFLGIVLLLLGIWAHFRRRPPIDVDLAKLASAIEALQGTVAKLTERTDSQAHHATEIEALQKEITGLRIAREADVAAQRSYTQRTTREIFERIEGVERAVATNFQSVERALGRIEGQLTRPGAGG